jgi:hypothetical protein
MFLEVKLEKKLKANLLAPFSIFLPDLFTKKGNYHRINIHSPSRACIITKTTAITKAINITVIVSSH